MLCQICEKEWREGAAEVPPAEATHMVDGLLVVGNYGGPLALCIHHANPGDVNDQNYQVYPINSPQGQSLLNYIALKKMARANGYSLQDAYPQAMRGGLGRKLWYQIKAYLQYLGGRHG